MTYIFFIVFNYETLFIKHLQGEEDFFHRRLIIDDKQKEYSILSSSNLDWTVVRIPMLLQTDRQSEVKTSLTDCMGKKINATDLACF